MLRENTVFAQKIIDFYTEKGVECSVVDEHLSLLVTLSADGRDHEFRYGNRAFGGMHHCRKFYMVLEQEWAKLKAASVEKGRTRFKYHGREDALEELSVNI